MQHVTRLCGSRLQQRLIPHTNHIRSSSSSVPSGGEQEATPPPQKLPSRTLRPRSHGNKPLPISALFDPVTISARTKHKIPKPLPPQNPTELTDLQRELAENVHAQALATPIRTCVLTKARLPSHFLIPFISQLPPKSSVPLQEGLREGLQEGLQEGLSPSLVPRIGAWAHYASQPSSYILAHGPAISHLSGPRMRKKSKGGGKWALLVSERMKRPWARRGGKGVDKVVVAREWIWDEEMMGRVRGLLGREVLRRLGWCRRHEGDELVGMDGEGVVVRVGGEGELVEGYDLGGMMDEECLAELRELFDGAEEFVLRRHPETVMTCLALEALKNYVEGDET